MTREYLIQRTDGEDFELHRDRYPEVLRPTRTTSRVVEGWGDHRIEVEGAEIAFSLEPPGLQVLFETGELPAERRRAIVEEILESIEGALSERGRILER